METIYHTTDVYSTTNDVFWKLGVELGEQNRLLVTWGVMYMTELSDA